MEHDEKYGINQMFEELDRRDPERARTAIVLIDSSESQQTAILDTARSHNRALTLVLDIIHALHYLWLAGFALNNKDSQKTAVWVLRFLEKMLTKPSETVISDIRRSADTRKVTKKQRQAINRSLRYFERRKSMMDYPKFLAQGLPIATGVIEGSCRHLIQDRLGITGARWGLNGAEAILKMRSLRTSGDWDDYLHFHECQEAQRNYLQAA